MWSGSGDAENLAGGRGRRGTGAPAVGGEDMGAEDQRRGLARPARGSSCHRRTARARSSRRVAWEAGAVTPATETLDGRAWGVGRCGGGDVNRGGGDWRRRKRRSIDGERRCWRRPATAGAEAAVAGQGERGGMERERWLERESERGRKRTWGRAARVSTWGGRRTWGRGGRSAVSHWM
jgi:hypothetical protein